MPQAHVLAFGRVFVPYPVGVPELPPLKPLDPPMTMFAVAGMIVWAILALACFFAKDWLTSHDHGTWLRICVAGLIWGIPGLLTMVRHDANRRRRLSQ